MVVTSYGTLREYFLLHPDAESVLKIWYALVTEADWNNLTEIKRVFNSVDYVGNDRYVFNIRGNNYRLVALIHFDIRTVYIRFVGTHAAYDKINASTI